MPKKKEDRSDWVAVAPEFATDTQSSSATTGIRKAQSAYAYFQASVANQVKEQITRENQGKFDIAIFGRAVRNRWTALSELEQQPFVVLAQQDASRFARESHMADIQAMERAQRVRQQREQVILPEGDDGDNPLEHLVLDGTRTTRHKLEKKLKQCRKKKLKLEKKASEAGAKGEDKVGEASAASDDQSSGSDSSSSSSAQKRKPSTTPRKISQKHQEFLASKKQDKVEKEQYITKRHEDLKQQRAEQATRRLAYLLKQSNIFSHFGVIKEDTVKYGKAVTSQSSTDGGLDGSQRSVEGASESARRDATKPTDEDELNALEEADEHEAVFLSKQPSTLAHGQMRDYQLEGLNWMIRLQEYGVNGILADEMGLGKTLQSISVLVYMKEYRDVNGPHLVIVPKSTLSNWMNEFARWAPTLKVVRFHGDKETRENIVKNDLEPAMRDEDRTWDVIVTTYEVCNIEKSSLSKFTWNYLIIDEAHRLKNEASTFAQTVRTFETRYRILLTGTPLQNSLHELWSLLNFLVPDVFESAEQFDEWFNLDIDDDNEKNKLISQLHKILRPFMLRRLKADVEKSLPPKHETILYTGMSKMQKDLYRNILIRDLDAIQGTSGSRTAIMNICMQLRKCAGHPYLFPSVEDRSLPALGEHLVENCGKMAVLDKLLKRLFDRGHRVLLFTQMTRILDILEDYLVMRRYQYCRIDGNTSYDDREAYIDAYNAPGSEKFIFLLSTRAGGLGINLQTADIVILYDSDWNPMQDLQAQDRAHRIGQTRPVQIFRLVTEHTIEEKIVERAQQKLKLDAMVVQQGRLKDKDKLSREELIAAVRFGADKIFKSKDSSITEDDIDLILDAGKRKTQELNEKLQAAEKGDLLDFKLDGSSVQTFEGVDYSASAIAQARAEADLLGIFDIGKRERKEANYNENSLYQQQVAAMGVHKKPKKKIIKLPRYLRLPRMEDWQMYDRASLFKIQEEEEAAFRALPEEEQKLATAMQGASQDQGVAARSPANHGGEKLKFHMPLLVSAERRMLKASLLAEGFSSWMRVHFSAFVKASAQYGRHEYEKIALETGKPERDVRAFAAAFWGDLGKSRFSEHEYERAVKAIERGEKKLNEIGSLERGIRLLVSLFDNPWEELEFSLINCKDKMFSMEEDRHLVCWMRKYGFGQWHAIRLAIRRNPTFRFNYFFRSLPLEPLARRCEQLARAAEKEVEQLERKARERAGLPTDPIDESDPLPPIELPKFRVFQKQQQREKRGRSLQEKRELETKVEDVEAQIREVQQRLKAINEGSTIASLTPELEDSSNTAKQGGEDSVAGEISSAGHAVIENERGGMVGGKFREYPQFDGREEPAEWKKPFTHFCIQTRKNVKASLDPMERKNKGMIHELLKERWLRLSDDDKAIWREWSEWDKRRFARDTVMFSRRQTRDDSKYKKRDASAETESHVAKKSKTG